MVKVSLVLLVPYAYVDGEAEKNEAVSNFINLFKTAAHTLQEKKHLNVQLILQPNLPRLVNVDVFDLNKKVERKWIPLAKVQHVQTASGNKHHYKILKVYPGGERERVLEQNLVVNSILPFKQGLHKNFYKLTESECFLYNKLPDGNLSEPWAKCLRYPSDEWKHYWKVLEVFPSGEGKQVGTEDSSTLLESERVSNGEHLFIKWKIKPKSFAFGYSTEVADGQITQEEKDKWETPEGLVTVLPLLRWYKSGDTVQYGFFRNTLLHHNTTTTKLKELSGPENIVYAHIFDPDVVSLDVKIAMKTELLFAAYATVIMDMARKKDKKELPAILSSSYCFEASDENAVINKLFALNSKVNKELHNLLPCAGYFSECNTLLRYDEEYWKNLKFARDRNEIMPIVKHLLREGKQAKYIEGAMQTSVPARMRKWQNVRLDQDEVTFFLFLEKCPQVPLKTTDWIHRVYSAISQFVESGEKIREGVGKLWKYFSPIRSFDKEFTMVDKSFRDFIQSGYDDHLQKNEVKLQSILKTLKKCTLTDKWDKQENLWDVVAETAKSCGNIYRNYIVSWWWDEAKSFDLNGLFDMENLS